MTLETRGRPIEKRAEGGKKVAGYAAVFNSETDIGGYFREKIAPGAFSDSLKADVRALLDHDHGRVIGRTAAGTLRLSEDEHGLSVEIDLPDTSDGRDAAVLIERGDLDGMSFGFVVTKQSWDETGDTPLRTIEKVELHEVSIVAFPAYGDTSIAMRSLDDARKDRSLHNYTAASRRIAARKARQEQRIRNI